MSKNDIIAAALRLGLSQRQAIACADTGCKPEVFAENLRRFTAANGPAVKHPASGFGGLRINAELAAISSRIREAKRSGNRAAILEAEAALTEYTKLTRSLPADEYAAMHKQSIGPRELARLKAALGPKLWTASLRRGADLREVAAMWRRVKAADAALSTAKPAAAAVQPSPIAAAVAEVERRRQARSGWLWALRRAPARDRAALRADVADAQRRLDKAIKTLAQLDPKNPAINADARALAEAEAEVNEALVEIEEAFMANTVEPAMIEKLRESLTALLEIHYLESADDHPALLELARLEEADARGDDEAFEAALEAFKKQLAGLQMPAEMPPAPPAPAEASRRNKSRSRPAKAPAPATARELRKRRARLASHGIACGDPQPLPMGQRLKGTNR